MTVDYTKHKKYTYDPIQFTLSGVSDTISGEWSTYSFNTETGHFTGFRLGDRVAERKSMTYMQEGFGLFVSREMPGDKLTEVRFDGAGRPIWFRAKGQLPVLERSSSSDFGEHTRSVFLDDVVSEHITCDKLTTLLTCPKK